MLSEKTIEDVKEMTTIMLQLDNTGRTIMLSNATVLLARQEINGNTGADIALVGQQADEQLEPARA